MRIFAGKYKGLKIETPSDIRPTIELVRKAMFSILGGSLEGESFLELFCGSGVVGIEALSLGAKKAVFVDSSKQSITATKRNLLNIAKVYPHTNLNKDESQVGVGVYYMDALKFIDYISKKGEVFDTIFIDPPYYKDLVKKTLISLSQYDILAPNGVVICQHSKKDVLPKDCGNLIQTRQKAYGDTILTFYSPR